MIRGTSKDKQALRKKKKEFEQFEKNLRKDFNEKMLIGIKNANYVCFAITVLNLKAEGWGPKRLKRFVEGYFALAEELEDNRMRAPEVIAWAEEETGIKIKDEMNIYLEGTEL